MNLGRGMRLHFPAPVYREAAPYTTAILPHVEAIIIPACHPKNKAKYKLH